MFDINNIINNIINAAINAAVQQAIAPLVEQIHNLDAICQAQHEGMVAMRDRIAVLAAELIADKPTTGLTRAQVEDLIEAKMDLHLECYDHDSYDNAVSTVDDLPDFDDFVRDGDMPDFDDFVKSGDVEDAVRDAISNLTFEVSVS